jgi:large repetitive protein
VNTRSAPVSPGARAWGALASAVLGAAVVACSSAEPKPAECGNGVIETAEECEGTPPPEGCSDSCRVEPGWSCEPPPASDGGTDDGLQGMMVMSTCTRLAGCGNGALDTGEVCDDANDVPADGCDGCQIESGWQCAGEPSVCAQCGDGQVDPMFEACDNAGGPGCTSTCQVVMGWACSGTPSLCVPVCGDGIWIGPDTLGVSEMLAEGCDDGNQAAGDGCSPGCEVEPGCDCGAQPTETSACTCPGDSTSDSGPADGTSSGDGSSGSGGSDSGSGSGSGSDGESSGGATGTTTGG